MGSPLSPFFATSASLFLKALAVLVAAGKVDTATADRVRAFLRDNQVAVSANLEAQLLPTKKAKTQPKRMCFVCYCSFQTEFGSCTTHTHTTLTCTHHVRVQVCRLKHEQRCARTPSGLHSSTSWSVERYLFATLIVVMVEEHRHRIHTTLEQPFPTTHAGAKENKLVRGCRCHR